MNYFIFKNLVQYLQSVQFHDYFDQGIEKIIHLYYIFVQL